MPVKQRDRDTGEQTDETITLFKTVFVFDAEQVDPLPSGQPTPLEPPYQPLTGDSHSHLIAPTVTFAESLGYTVSFESIAASTGGWCDAKRERIVVDTDVPANAQLRTLVHEAIDALGVDDQRYLRAQAEVIVDTTTLVVLGGLGLDVSGETVPYVAGWGEDGAPRAVTEFAHLIDALARRVQAALSIAGDTQGSAGPPEGWLASSRAYVPRPIRPVHPESRRELRPGADDRASSGAGVGSALVETPACQRSSATSV